ncbi:TetR/AcrR family transcriptional regulator [Nocardia donostiensis]|uniref:TetR family transcriptional regulator n=1 Tax=Nocardia donostiensis TaxID=1538463 RepID=A0A1W0BNL2_9NOCA|nr:TetR/AcrR family transcriptional regulator [Nocardia donostiensis]ONM47440.1 TetR family transcriptional regulator [Nocardia donostiensis]OQS14330.1 TetR family transcriptional regulator [Nocardia donostiensis]OQS24093.1 TetR family transcriptional regulator [Nocardia donostiensis]
MSTGWLAESRAELASERILDAVRALFLDKGVTTVGMAEVAEAAGCSRATLYRYFDNREALYVAFAGREARQLIERVWRDYPLDGPDLADQLLDGMAATLAEARKTPHLAVWFEPANAGIVAQLSNSSAVIDSLVTAFVAHFRPDLHPAAAERLGRWAVRVMVSLLTLPPAGEDEERALLRNFLLPFLLDDTIVIT